MTMSAADDPDAPDAAVPARATPRYHLPQHAGCGPPGPEGAGGPGHPAEDASAAGGAQL